MKFDTIQAVIADMDGVLWRGNDPLPGMREFFAFVHEANIPFMLATNNSSRTTPQYVEKIAGMGAVGVSEANIVTSASATVDFLLNAYPIGADVHIVGEPGLYQRIEEAGFNIVNAEAEVVVVGIDRDITYEKLKRASLMIRAGARFIGTNPDKTFPSEEGLIPGAGTIINAVATASGQQAEIIGKPHAPMFQTALASLGTPAENTLMIGDRIDTDITGGLRTGMKTALVFTGVTQPEDLITSDDQPHVAYEDLAALLKAWDYSGGKRRR